MHEILHREVRALAAVTTLALGVLLGRVALVPEPAPPSVRPLLIDLNTASLEVLTILPGVGRKTAIVIMAGRPYADRADLARVLGPERARRLREHLAPP